MIIVVVVVMMMMMIIIIFCGAVQVNIWVEQNTFILIAPILNTFIKE